MGSFRFLFPLLDAADEKSVIVFGGTTLINCGSDASIDDLQDAAFTVDLWVRNDNTAPFFPLVFKGLPNDTKWSFQIIYFGPYGYGLTGNVKAVTQTANSRAAGAWYLAELNAGEWCHVLMTYDDGGDRKVYLAINGVWAPSYSLQDAAIDAIISDASEDLIIGDRVGIGGSVPDGAMAWARISDNVRYTVGVGFTPPEIDQPPEVDANTVALWRMDEGSGTAVSDETGNNDGTLSNGSWSTL